MDDLLWKAFQAGFDATAEGFNGEVNCRDDAAVERAYANWVVGLGLDIHITTRPRWSAPIEICATLPVTPSDD